MNWKGARRSVLIAGEGQPTAPMIAGNYDPLCMQGLVQSVQLPRRHGEVETPTSNQPPCGAQDRRLLGPVALRSCPFASLHGKPGRALGPGATVGVRGTGVPRLACLRLAAWLKGGPNTARLHQHKPKTLARGQASRGGRRGASSGTALSGWLTRRRRDQGGVPHEVPVTQAMMTQGARRVPARAASSFPLWCKGGKRSRGVPWPQAKVAISVQQDQDHGLQDGGHRGAQNSVTTKTLCRGRLLFSG